ncbi:hypothetical protein R6Q57_020237 [Mikania cordata]
MEDSNSIASRRLAAIQTHLIASTDNTDSLIRSNVTAGEFVDERRYSVVLPEKLKSGKWNVYRSARSPLKLVTRFPDHTEIETLHDNFVHAVDAFPDYKYLGSRVRVDGTVGEYKWMTYGETATARSAIGSGLQYHGLSEYDNLGQLCNDPRAKAAVLAEMDAVAREAQLRGFEFAKAVTLVPEPFTVENGLLTPTFKVKRPQAKAYFEKDISNMYAELSTMDPTLHKPL